MLKDTIKKYLLKALKVMVSIKKSRKKFFLFITTQVLVIFLLSLIVDRSAGYFLSKNGYFKAFVPNITDIHISNEYEFTEKTSSQGLRNEEVKIPKPQNIYRILALGDSFTWGQGVKLEQSWPKVLESSLSSRLSKQVEIINAGIWGASLSTEIEACKIYADRFNVDAVIVAIYSTDDFVQEANIDYIKTNQPAAVTIVSKLWPTLSKIKRHYLASLSYQSPGSTNYTQRISKQVVQEKIAKDPLLMLKIDPQIRKDFMEGLINPPTILMPLSEPDILNYMLSKPDYDLAMGILDKKFTAFKKDCSKKRPVAVAFIPGPEMVSKKYQEYRKITGYNTDNRLLTFDFDKDLSLLAAKNNFSYASVLSEFRKDGCEGCYYPWDSHFTPTGQQRFANYLLKPTLSAINR